MDQTSSQAKKVKTEMLCYKDYSFEISKPTYHCLQVLNKIKVLVIFNEWQNDRQDKTVCPTIFDLGGIKMDYT